MKSGLLFWRAGRFFCIPREPIRLHIEKIHRFLSLYGMSEMFFSAIGKAGACDEKNGLNYSMAVVEAVLVPVFFLLPA